MESEETGCLACARDGLGREDLGFPDRSSTETGVTGLTVPNTHDRIP
jgi:hypothetical protein